MTLEERVARLEARIPELHQSLSLGEKTFYAALVLSGFGVYSGWRGMGEPNHAYQLALGILAATLAYHRRWFVWPAKKHHWVLAPINAALFSMLFKLLIGGGKRQPFFWLKYPDFVSQKAEGSFLPQFGFAWQPTGLSAWELDFTVIQTFLLIITLIGALFDMDIFVALTAFLLILISVPIFASFEWSWVFPALMVAGVSFYLQSQVAARNPKT